MLKAGLVWCKRLVLQSKITACYNNEIKEYNINILEFKIYIPSIIITSLYGVFIFLNNNHLTLKLIVYFVFSSIYFFYYKKSMGVLMKEIKRRH